MYFGRMLAPDINDRRYSMDLVLPTEWPHARKRQWTAGNIPNQTQGPVGLRNSCVGHGCRQLLTSTPKPRHDGPDGFQLYDRAKRSDAWVENDNTDEGTAVRAGFQVLRQLNYIGTYLWATQVDQIAKWILRKGPVVIGTQWLDRMIDPDSYNRIHARGQVLGLHCTCLIGADRNEQEFTLANSWGYEWGYHGCAYLSFDDLSLLLQTQGEAVVAIERRLTGT